MIRLSCPATLAHRHLALGVVAGVCRMARGETRPGVLGAPALEHDLEIHVVSAVAEAFNNVVLHGYAGRPAGTVELEIEQAAGRLTIRMMDFGASFDPAATPPPALEDPLPESGFGLHIIRSFMDELEYRPGRPNVFRLTKYLPRAPADLSARV